MNESFDFEGEPELKIDHLFRYGGAPLLEVRNIKGKNCVDYLAPKFPDVKKLVREFIGGRTSHSLEVLAMPRIFNAKKTTTTGSTTSTGVSSTASSVSSRAGSKASSRVSSATDSEYSGASSATSSANDDTVGEHTDTVDH